MSYSHGDAAAKIFDRPRYFPRGISEVQTQRLQTPVCPGRTSTCTIVSGVPESENTRRVSIRRPRKVHAIIKRGKTKKNCIDYDHRDDDTLQRTYRDAT